MSFMLVYNKPGRGPYTYKIGARSVEEATRTGRELGEANPEYWGTFRYARSPYRAGIALNELYTLRPAPIGLRYRKEWEEVDAPFDYIAYSGGSVAELRFYLEWIEPISRGKVSLCARFDAGRSGKFLDMCKSYKARFILRDGAPVLQFVRNLSYDVVFEIPLMPEH